MKLFIDTKLVLENYSADPSTPIQQLDEMDSLYEDILANLSKDTKVPKDVLDSFKIKNTLNQDIWVGDKLNPKVRHKLILIAKDFMKGLEMKTKPQIVDIIFTGSLANFNWSKYSDIDLHIVIDFKKMGDDASFIEDYFWAQKALWNEEHDITIFNYPIEIYVQDIKAKLEATAIYSVLNDKWILKPKPTEFKLDKSAIKIKAEKFLNQLRDIKNNYDNKDYQNVVDKVNKLKNHIKNMRTAGLEKGGEFSLENLVFKVLRRTPFMDYLDSYKNKAYDNLMSVAETLKENSLLTKTSFRTKENDGEHSIDAIFNSQRIGHISFTEIIGGYMNFDDDFSEEQYNEMFPDDKFINIEWLGIKYDEHKKQGIARELMKRALIISKKLGYNRIYLNASPIGNEISTKALVDFYKSFGFKEILNQGHNVQMLLIINDTVSEMLHENDIYNQGGVILIKGLQQEDGTQRLYATNITKLLNLNRMKVNATSGKPANMAILGNPIVRISIQDGRLKAHNIGWSSPENMRKQLAIDNKGVVINNNKTPLHWETLQFNNIGQCLSKLSGQIMNLNGIKWIG